MDYLKKYSRLGTSLQGSEIRRLFSVSMQPDVISFAGGMPDPALFPSVRIAATVEKVLKEKGDRLLQYGPSRGTAEGIETVLYLLDRRNIKSESSQIVITAGAQQAINLATQVLIDPGDVILVEEPTFIGALGVFRNASAEITPIPMDEKGIIPAHLATVCEALQKKGKIIKLLYTIPNFQNPSGLTLAPERRPDVLRLAQYYDFMILEDDAYGELDFDLPSTSTEPIKALDREGRVIYLGSFSKILSPGIRLGWITAAEPLIDRLDMAKQMLDVCPNPLMQAVVSQLCREDFFLDHIPLLRKQYQNRCHAMLQALETNMPKEVTWTRPHGGFYIWLTFPESYDTQKMLPMALEDKVAYVIGSAFSASGKLHNTLRLAFSHESEQVIEEGIKRLAKTVINIFDQGGSK
jgi:2-aminoadipate transaminase